MCVRFMQLLRTLNTVRPKLSEVEKRKISTLYEEKVQQLSTEAGILEFLHGVGLTLSEAELADLLDFVHFDSRSGRAILLRQLLKVVQVLKNRYESSITTDAFEAFSALKEQATAQDLRQLEDSRGDMGQENAVPVATLKEYFRELALAPDDSVLKGIDKEDGAVKYDWFEENLGTADDGLEEAMLIAANRGRAPSFFVPAATRHRVARLFRRKPSNSGFGDLDNSLSGMNPLSGVGDVTMAASFVFSPLSATTPSMRDGQTPTMRIGRTASIRDSPSMAGQKAQAGGKGSMPPERRGTFTFHVDSPQQQGSDSASRPRLGSFSASAALGSTLGRSGNSRLTGHATKKEDEFKRYLQHRRNSREIEDAQAREQERAHQYQEYLENLSQRVKAVEFGSNPLFETSTLNLSGVAGTSPSANLSGLGGDALAVNQTVHRYAFPNEHHPGGRQQWRPEDVTNRHAFLQRGTAHRTKVSRNIQYSTGDDSVPHHEGLQCLNASYDHSLVVAREKGWRPGMAFPVTTGAKSNKRPQSRGLPTPSFGLDQEIERSRIMQRLTTPKPTVQHWDRPAQLSLLRPESAPAFTGGATACRTRRKFAERLPTKSVNDLAAVPSYFLDPDTKKAIIAAKISNAASHPQPISGEVKTVAAMALRLLDRPTIGYAPAPQVSAMRPASALLP